MSAEDARVLVVTAAAFAPRSLPAGSLVMRHRGTAWSAAACVPLGEADAANVVDQIKAAGVRPMRLALGRVQPGLDMWRPYGPARAEIGIYEYVTSRPESRAAYYRSQYTASGPAMRELWLRGYVQRFLGIEILDDLGPTDHGGWDVLHVTALAVRALPRMLLWRRRFDEQARAAGYGSMRALQQDWQRQRTKVQGRARIRIVGEG